MITIHNEFLTADIAERGAELKRLQWNGRDYIFRGNEEHWAGSCPLLFPVCSGLKDDRYFLGEKSYPMQKHGFARFKTFSVESVGDGCATFLLREDEESLGIFPFRFSLYVDYRMEGKQLFVTYRVVNRDTERMPFSIGAHEGYACPEGIEQYDVIFGGKETLDSSVLEGNLLGYRTVRVLTDSDTLPLQYEYFSVDALVFKALRSKEATLRNRVTGHALKVRFDGFPYFLLWSKPGAPFICLEPWCGISDATDADGNFYEKEGIHILSPGETFTRTHSIEILA